MSFIHDDFAAFEVFDGDGWLGGVYDFIVFNELDGGGWQSEVGTVFF